MRRPSLLSSAMPFEAAAAAFFVLLSTVACGSSHPGSDKATLSGDDAGAGPVTKDAGLPEGCRHTTFGGDDLCIAPPPEAEGFQIHVGPSDYDDPEEMAKYTLGPGKEIDNNYYLKSTNSEDIYFYKRSYRMRPGSHHLILSEIQEDHDDGWDTPAKSGASAGTPSSFGLGRRLGGSQNESKDNPTNLVVPPENEGIGMPLKGHAQLDVNFHHYNGTDQDILREAWINFYYVDAASVTHEANEMFAVGGFAMHIDPGTHTTLKYSVPVNSDGRVLTMYGHRHAHNIRFSAWRTRGDQRDLVYDGYNWKEPMVLEFSSTETNPPPDPVAKTEGGWSGMLDLKAGDSLDWECEINNDGSKTLNFTNETVDGEMCILVGDTIGPIVAGAIP